MASQGPSAARIRAQLDHPVIDVDGHVLEFMPASLPYLREALGQRNFDRYLAMRKPVEDAMSNPSRAHRLTTRKPQAGWWGSPVADPLDLATSLFPRLLHERTEELGIDYMILYPTHALGTAGIQDDELRQGLCRGFNAFFADLYGPFADRLAPAGMIPMNTPDEAVAELGHCKTLGLKVVGIPHGVMRQITAPDRDREESPWLWPGQNHWWDYFGHESAYDYDPVWARFFELGYAVTAHGGVGAPPTNHYTSTSSWMYNHIGSFAAMMYPLCKSLYFHGVTQRFPELNIAFLECGVTWACSLLSDTKEHYEKRNIEKLKDVFDPTMLDIERLSELASRYAPELVASFEGDVREALRAALLGGPPPEDLDEFPCFSNKDDLRAPFESFFFGCEADDRGVAFAFSDANAFGTTLKPMLSSDISHFDVPVMTDVLPDAHALLQEGLVCPEEFRAFSYENAASLHLRTNPDFFTGTSVESFVKDFDLPNR